MSNTAAPFGLSGRMSQRSRSTPSRAAIIELANVAATDAASRRAELERRSAVELSGPDRGAVLIETVAEIGRRLSDLAAADPELAGMGTTLTALLWDGAGFAGGHLGDRVEDDDGFGHDVSPERKSLLFRQRERAGSRVGARNLEHFPTRRNRRGGIPL